MGIEGQEVILGRRDGKINTKGRVKHKAQLICRVWNLKLEKKVGTQKLKV